MSIYSKYCHIEVNMCKGQIYSARMYTAIETKAGEKEYWKKLTAVEAGIAMRKLQKVTGIKPEIRYNMFDADLTNKQIVYYWEK